MTRTQRRKYPVTVRKFSSVRCEVCRKAISYPPGRANKALTDHYREKHPDYR